MMWAGVLAAAIAAPLLDVVVINYHQTNYTQRAVASLPAEANVIVVHDGEDHREIEFDRPVQQIIKRHGGLADSRNFGVAASTAPYVMCLDGDDYLLPSFYAEISPSLRAGVDIVQTDMSRTDGTLIWAPPDYNSSTLHRMNQFHASAVYKRELWELVGGYRPALFYGWEDWDFWLRISARRPNLKTKTVRKGLFVYDYGTMHGFCVEHHADCRAFFALANPDFFPRSELRTAAKRMATPSSPLWSHHMLDVSIPVVHAKDSPLLEVGRAIGQNDVKAAVAAADPTNIATAIMIDALVWPDSPADVPESPAGADTFHYFVTVANAETRAVLRTSLTSLFRADPAAVAVVWTTQALDLSDIDPKGSVIIRPFNAIEYAVDSGNGKVVLSIMRHVGTDFFRTHITDVLRYVVLSGEGGTYVDVDVLFHPALKTVRIESAVGVEDYWNREIVHLNGALLLRFGPESPFILECLRRVEHVHDPTVYNCIGPALVTTVGLEFRANGSACVEVPEVLPVNTPGSAPSPVDETTCVGSAKPLTILDTSAFYYYHWSAKYKELAFRKSTVFVDDALEQRPSGAIASHLWNGLWHPARADPTTLIGQLMRRNGLAEFNATVDKYDVGRIVARNRRLKAGSTESTAQPSTAEPTTPSTAMTEPPTKAPPSKKNHQLINEIYNKLVKSKKFTPEKLAAVLIEVSVVERTHTSTLSAESAADLCLFVSSAVESLEERGHTSISAAYANMGGVSCGQALRSSAYAAIGDGDPEATITSLEAAVNDGGGSTGGSTGDDDSGGGLDEATTLGLAIGIPVGVLGIGGGVWWALRPTQEYRIFKN